MNNESLHLINFTDLPLKVQNEIKNLIILKEEIKKRKKEKWLLTCLSVEVSLLEWFFGLFGRDGFNASNLLRYGWNNCRFVWL